MKKGHLPMPLLFIISGGWKALFDLVKKRRAIAADQRGSVRASAPRGRGGYPGITRRFFATACAAMASPYRVRETLTYFGQRFAHIALPKP